MRQILTFVVTIPLMVWVLAQVRKPSGPLGWLLLWLMNRSHATLTDWGLTQIQLRQSDTVLDIGCGGGRTVRKLAALAPEGTVHGIDYSATSVATSRSTNAEAIASGRVQIAQASVAALPFPDQTFDVATAVETHYYWPDLPVNLREVLRVMKPGGTIAIIAETHGGGRLDALYRPVMRLIRAAFLSADEHRDLLVISGYVDVSIAHAPGQSWICATGRKPPPAKRSPQPAIHRSD